jgi:hypothetical protein
MEIIVKKIKENKDGSADVHVHYDKEGLHFLVQQGLTMTLVEAIMTEKTGKFYNVSSILKTVPKKTVVKKQQTKKK